MTDVHSHIIFDVDDGSSTLEESLKLVRYLASLGFQNLIATPHYIDGSDYCAENEEKLKKLAILRDAVAKEGINVNIYLGNEIFIAEDILRLVKEQKIYSLNNSKYLLIELPFHNKIINLEDIFFEIKCAGYIPILAHPERYTYFQKDYKLVDSLKENEILFQCNFSSILNQYGHEAKKLMKYMLKKKYVDYLGTDIHHIGKTFVLDNFSKIQKKIITIAGLDYYNQIIENGNNIIEEE